jgi:glycosyltransferase involved in cell wall biosynthesis
VALITNIPAPYRLPAFRSLSQAVALTVVYCAERGQGGLSWRLDLDREPFPVVQLNSRARARGNVDRYASLGVGRALRLLRPDVVITGGFSFPSVYAALYCSAYGVPLIVFSDGTSDSERTISVGQKLARRLLVWRSDAAVAASHPAARRFHEMGFPQPRIHLSLHSSDMDRFWAVARDRRPQTEHRSVRFLFVGRLASGKGLDKLLAAFSESRRAVPGITLTIVGDGPLRSGLEEEVARTAGEGVVFKGFIDQDEMPGVYADADVLVFPSLGDTFGMALLEAAASGLALISSPLAGATEHLVREGESGLIVDPHSHGALVDALVHTGRAPASCVAFGKAAHRLSRAHTVEAASAGYLGAISQALGRSDAVTNRGPSNSARSRLNRSGL